MFLWYPIINIQACIHCFKDLIKYLIHLVYQRSNSTISLCPFITLHGRRQTTTPQTTLNPSTCLTRSALLYSQTYLDSITLNSLLYFLYLIASGSLNLSDNYVRVCYITSWSQYEYGSSKFRTSEIDPFLCTHIVYSYALVMDGILSSSEWNAKGLNLTNKMYLTFSLHLIPSFTHLTPSHISNTSDGGLGGRGVSY